MGEAINGIVKHFHKPEKEVSEGSLDRLQHALLLFITTDEERRSALVVPHTPPPQSCHHNVFSKEDKKETLEQIISSRDYLFLC